MFPVGVPVCPCRVVSLDVVTSCSTRDLANKVTLVQSTQHAPWSRHFPAATSSWNFLFIHSLLEADIWPSCSHLPHARASSCVLLLLQPGTPSPNHLCPKSWWNIRRRTRLVMKNPIRVPRDLARPDPVLSIHSVLLPSSSLLCARGVHHLRWSSPPARSASRPPPWAWYSCGLGSSVLHWPWPEGMGTWPAAACWAAWVPPWPPPGTVRTN